MKLQTMLLVIAAAWLAAAPSRGLSQDLGPLTPEFEAWQNGSLVSDLGVDNPALANPAEDIWCGTGCCGCCGDCLKTRDIWVSAEGLAWWAKGSRLPPLVTTGPQASGGILGQPGTTVLFGNEYVGDDLQTGARVTFGVWLDNDHNVTLGGKFYGLSGDGENFFADSDGDPLLARPFFNVLTNLNDALLIASTGEVEGNITINYDSHNFIGSEAFVEIMMHRERLRRVDLILGYHFLRMDDRLLIDSFHEIVNPIDPLVGTTFTFSDRFLTENEFHGGEIGLKGRMARGAWSFDGLLKASLGTQRQEVTIQGSGTINIPPGPAAPLNGGFLALPTNIGTFERNRFTVIPEAMLNLTYHHTPCLSFHMGYNLIWMPHAVTAGDQIDLAVNLTQQNGVLVGPARPAFPFFERDFWVQGINFGVNLDF